MTEKRTNKQIIRTALLLAINWEHGLLDSYRGATGDETIKMRDLCSRNIADFTKLLTEKYGGFPDDPLAEAKTVSIYDLLN